MNQPPRSFRKCVGSAIDTLLAALIEGLHTLVAKVGGIEDRESRWPEEVAAVKLLLASIAQDIDTHKDIMQVCGEQGHGGDC